VFDVSGAVDKVPEVGWLPLHPPDAVQFWALVVLQFNVVE
jgi:hypothetical protein